MLNERRLLPDWVRLRALTLVLVLVLLALQYPLWLGKRGWLQVWELRDKLQTETQARLQKVHRNQVLSAEAADLKGSLEGIEERARFDQRLVRPQETFYSWSAPPTPTAESSPH